MSNSSLLSFNVNKPSERRIRGAETHAGDSYLSWCQRHWSELHRESEKNALKAQAVDGMVTDIASRLERQHSAMSVFLQELQAFTELVKTVTCVKDKVSELSETCTKLESMLIVLEDACEDVQQQKNRHEHEAQLAGYQERKHLQLEQAKVQLAKQHASNVQHFEQHVNAVLRERQQVFEEAFVQQMHNYRISGRIHGDTVDSPVVSVSPPTDVDLGDIVVDENLSVLNDFLESPDPVAVNSTQSLPDVGQTVFASVIADGSQAPICDDSQSDGGVTTENNESVLHCTTLQHLPDICSTDDADGAHVPVHEDSVPDVNNAFSVHSIIEDGSAFHDDVKDQVLNSNSVVPLLPDATDSL
jgi:hypothetical protein